MKTYNIFNTKKLLLLILVAAIGFSGCKKFLDVNTNPNNPDTAEPSLLLPTVEAAVSQIVGNAFQIYGNIWGQYWTQNPSSSQYRVIDQYSMPGTASDRSWLILYRSALINADLITKAKGPGLQYMQGMAYILKAYGFQLATDAYGDIPVSQSLSGTSYLSPVYDTQAVVYDSIFKYIDLGKGLLATASATNPGIQDMIFQGDNAKWTAFANTLKLRAYLRLAKADPTKAQAGIAALYATNPTFLTADATIKYTTTGGNENPLYNEMASSTLNKVQNVVASSTAVDNFTRNNDPRRFKFYDPASDGTALVAIAQGSYANSANTTKKISPPSALVGGNASNATSATAPVKLISASESYFLQSEAVARGWATGDATALLNQGITASFTAVGLTAADATTYIAAAPDAAPAMLLATTVEAKVKVIITQKYYAMCGFQGFEAWTEWRRTGYPSFFVTSAASTLGAGRMPLRMIYPNSELTTNLNFPGNILIYNPVYWDKTHTAN